MVEIRGAFDDDKKSRLSSRWLLWGGAATLAIVVFWAGGLLYHLSLHDSVLHDPNFLTLDAGEGDATHVAGITRMVERDHERIRLFYFGFGFAFLLFLLAVTWGGDFLLRRHAQDVLQLRDTNEILQKRMDAFEQAEQTLVESEQRFRNIIQSSPMGIYLYELDDQGDLHLIDANPAADQMTGINNQALVGKRIEDAFPALVDSEIPERYKAVAREGVKWKTRTFAYEDERIHGAFDVWAFQTTPGRMAVQFLDVTDRQQAMEALRESEQRYRLLFESANDAIILVNEGGFLDCNEHALDMFGCTREELASTNAIDFSPKEQPDGMDSAEAYRHYIDQVFKGDPLRFYWVHQRKDGSQFDAEVSLSLLDMKGQPLIQAMIRDISDQKRIERDLRESEERFRRLTENAQDMIYRMRLPDGLYEYVSPAATEITGYSPQEWYEQPGLIREVIAPGWEDYFSQEWEKLLAGDMSPTYEYQIVNKFGTTRWLFQRNVLVKDEGGEPVAIEGIVTDMTQRRSVEVEVARSQALLTTAVEQTSAGIIIADAPTGTIRLVNSAALGIRGGEQANLVDIPIEDHPQHWKTYRLDGRLYEPEDLPLSRAIMHGEVVTNEEVIIENIEGQRRWVLANAAPVRDYTGEIIAGIVIFPDITAQKMTEEALRDSEERSRRVLETMQDGVGIIDEAGQIIYTNRAFAAMYGYAMEELVGVHVTQLIHPEYHFVLQDLLNTCTQSGDSFTGESTDIRKDGSTFLTEIQARSLELGGQKCIMGVVRDVTKHRAEQQLLRFTRFTVDQAKIAVFWCHSDGFFFYVNKTACDWLQYSRDELLQMHVADINPEFPREGWEGHWQEIKEKGMVRLESYHRRKNGEVYPVEIYSNYVMHDDIEYKLAFVHDISERRQAEEKLKQYREHLEELVELRTAELRRANEEMEAFVYSVSHDLRSPLRSMDGFSLAILEDYQERLDETGQDYLHRIRGAANRMGILIDDLLGLSRVSRSEMKCERVNLAEIAQRLFAMFQEQEPERCVHVEIQSSLEAFGDPGLLEVVLQNLLGNAWKFTKEKEEARIQFLSNQENGETIYQIHDNGAGFDMEYADKLFGVFQRLHGAREFEGTGVGLATVQRVIQRHSGRIWAESSIGEGASFYFTLALSEDRIES